MNVDSPLAIFAPKTFFPVKFPQCSASSDIINGRLTHLTIDKQNMHNPSDLEIDRWTVIGRLTASLFHEINNPLQAIHGALSLALEELDAPEAIEAYAHLSQVETRRIINLIQRAREIYRPASDKPAPFLLHKVLAGDLILISKELSRQHINLEREIAPDFPPIWAVGHQIRLLILVGFLALSETMGAAGGGNMTLSARSNGRHLYLDYHGRTKKPLTPQVLTEHFCQIGRQLAEQNQGQFQCQITDFDLSLQISFPIFQANQA
ncbi:MAG: histidine kinase dimerization/phospho-acceptor domain-containing protein [Anaerolineae bacterium]